MIKSRLILPGPAARAKPSQTAGAEGQTQPPELSSNATLPRVELRNRRSPHSRITRILAAASLFFTTTLFFPAAASCQAYIVTSPETMSRGSLEVDLYTEIGIYDSDGSRTRAAYPSLYIYYGFARSAEISLATSGGIGKYYPGDDESSKITGMADSGIEIKRNFYMKGPYQAAASIYLTLPTGNGEKNSDMGRRSHSFNLYTMKSAGKATYYFNFGFDRNLNDRNEKTNIKSYTLCADNQLVGKLSSRLSVSATDDSSPEASSRLNSVYAGISYAPAECIDVGIGYYRGLNYDSRSLLLYTGYYKQF